MTLWAQLQSVGKEDWVLQFDTRRRSQFSIGRHPSCSLVLNDMHISSKHISISQRLSPEGLREVIVEDSSSNGTWIDGEKLDRGVPVRLLSGSEIAFPCEDIDRRNYTFSFSVLVDVNEPVDDESDNSAASSSPAAMVPAASSPLSSQEASYAHLEQKQSSEQWRELERLQDQLALEASRLAASVHSNRDAMRELAAATASFGAEDPRDGRTVELGGAGEALREAQAANDHLTNIIQSMVGSMRRARDALSRLPGVGEKDREEVLTALSAERYEAALDELLGSERTRARESS